MSGRLHGSGKRVFLPGCNGVMLRVKYNVQFQNLIFMGRGRSSDFGGGFLGTARIEEIGMKSRAGWPELLFRFPGPRT